MGLSKKSFRSLNYNSDDIRINGTEKNSMSAFDLEQGTMQI